MKISIPEPCHEDWQKMLPDEKGRFCLNCQKSVVDFTNKSNREIIDYLKNNSKACGRFNTSQLNVHLQPEGNKSISKWQTYFLGLMAFLGIELTNTQNAKAQNITIKGKVIDKDKQGVPGVSINLGNTRVGTVSDAEGLFLLEVSQQDSLSKIEIKGVGYKDTSFVVKTIPKEWIVELKEDDDVSMGLYTIIRPPLHKRVWWWITKPFRRKNY